MAPRSAAVALSLAALLAGCGHAVDRDDVTTTGRISAVDCGRGAVSVTFEAGGQAYESRAPAGVVDCREARVGRPLIVAYRPLEPASNTVITLATTRR